MSALRPSAGIAVLVGIGLLALAARAGSAAGVLAALPAALLVAGGVRCLRNPDPFAPQHVALGSVASALLALPLGLVGGAPLAVAALAAAGAGFLAAGWTDITLQPPLEDVPAPRPAPGYAARVAIDDVFLGAMAFGSPAQTPVTLREAVAEAEAAFAVYRQNGWLEDPASFHVEPPPAEPAEPSPVRIRGVDARHVRFESGYEPPAGLPQRERWLSFEENRTSHAWIAEHAGPERPWLVCIHGFGMGEPKQDFQAFRVRHFHERVGLNVATVALPVHGPRSPTRMSGMEYMGLSPLRFVHAEAQALWDVRRLLGWLRARGATRIGVHGISLGGYTTAVLAALEGDLACAIAGVPPADLIATGERLASAYEKRLARAAGVDLERDRALHAVVSPLALAPRVPREARSIYAGTGDQFVPIEQVRALWRHWERPRIAWSVGGHVSALMQQAPRMLVDEAVAASLGPVPAT